MAPLHSRVLHINISDEETGRVVRLVWHSEPCAAADPLHMELADILSSADKPVGATYNRILKRLREYVKAEVPAAKQLLTMQRTVGIRKDVSNPHFTSRAANVDQWGALARRRGR